MEGRTDGQMSGNTPCVPQDIGPEGPLPKKAVNDEHEHDEYLNDDYFLLFDLPSPP